MCGIFGFQYNPDPDKLLSLEKRAIIATLLAAEIETRGRDSSGFAFYDAENDKVMYRRDLGKYTTSALMPETALATNLLAHSRFATVGAKTIDNTHPWVINGVVGAHNGGVFNYTEIAKQYPDREYEVDSMHLIRHIADRLDTEELTGYGTVEWFDLTDSGAIYLCAMNGGDLHIEVLPEEMGVVWASTRTACQTALSAIPYKGSTLYTRAKSFATTESRVYRIKDGAIETTEREIKLQPRYKSSVKSYVSPSTATPYRSNGYTGAWVQGTDGVWRAPDDNTGSDDTVPFGSRGGRECIVSRTEVSSKRSTTKTKEPTDVADYRRAVAMYEKDIAKLLGPDNGLTRRQARHLTRLMARTETHEAHCHCMSCIEIFRLAASGT